MRCGVALDGSALSKAKQRVMSRVLAATARFVRSGGATNTENPGAPAGALIVWGPDRMDGSGCGDTQHPILAE